MSCPGGEGAARASAGDAGFPFEWLSFRQAQVIGLYLNGLEAPGIAARIGIDGDEAERSLRFALALIGADDREGTAAKLGLPPPRLIHELS